MLKVYIAGFDVFHKDASYILGCRQNTCKEFGLIGLSPFDNEIKFSGNKYIDAKTIRDANCKMIESCDYVIANCNSFRGYEPDSGTCFEIGYASALNKKILLYTDKYNLTMKASCYDPEYNVEDFDLPLNLMLCCSSEYIGKDFIDCIAYIIKTSE